MSYCQYVRGLEAKEDVLSATEILHVNYHNNSYGVLLSDDNELFGRLLMEINQAGLSWELILRKEAGLRAAYADFDIARVAAFTEDDRARLLNDPGIIRNRLKVNAAIENARRLLALQASHGSFSAWLLSHGTLSRQAWTALFKKTFLFTGGEIVNEFLMSVGLLPGAHDPDCPYFACK